MAAAAVVDVAPGLQKKIMTDLKSQLAGNKRFQRLCDVLANGEATLATAHEVAIVVGEQTSAVLMSVLTPDVLPDGRLWYNIADRTMRPAMEFGDSVVAKYTEAVQTQLNQQAGLNIKTIRPKTNTNNIKNLCGLASDYEDFADGRWVLGDPVVTNSEMMVDRFVQVNAMFAEQSGLAPQIVRIAEPDCCPWCADLEGYYDYAEVRNKGNDVYRRHNNCHCVVEYFPMTGRSQNVWDHTQWRNY